MENSKIKLILGIIGGLLIIIITIFLIKGSDKKGPNNTELTFWGYQDEETDIAPLIELYQEKNKNVKITYKKIEETPVEYEKKITDAIASGEGPDIFQIRNDWVPKHYKKIVPVPSSIISLDEFKNDYFEVAQNDLIYNNELYAIPFYVDNLAIFYNNEIFNEKYLIEPANTWDSFKDMIKKLRTLDGNFINLAAIPMGTANNIEYAEDILYALFLQNNTKMTSDDFKEAYFNLSIKDKGNIVYPGTSALEFYTSFSDPTKETYTWREEMPNSIEAFASQKTAMVFGYAADVKKIKKLTNGKLYFSTSSFPQVLGNEVYFAKYWANTVNKNSQNQKQAWDFLKFSTKDEAINKYTNKSMLPPAKKETAKNYEGTENMGTFIDQAEKSKTWHKGNWEKTDKIFKDLINDVNLNKQPTQDAINNAAKKVTSILRDMAERNED